MKMMIMVMMLVCVFCDDAIDDIGGHSDADASGVGSGSGNGSGSGSMRVSSSK